MEFYNLKTRSKIDVPEKQIKKQRYERKTANGKTQTRYALIADHDGTRLFRFVNEETFSSTKVPETAQ